MNNKLIRVINDGDFNKKGTIGVQFITSMMIVAEFYCMSHCDVFLTSASLVTSH